MFTIRKGIKVFATEYLRKKLNEVKRASPVEINNDLRLSTAINNVEA